jgi:hypothetical protein
VSSYYDEQVLDNLAPQHDRTPALPRGRLSFIAQKKQSSYPFQREKGTYGE